MGDLLGMLGQMFWGFAATGVLMWAGWLVPRQTYRKAIQERDTWRQVADKRMQGMERLSEIVKEAQSANGVQYRDKSVKRHRLDGDLMHPYAQGGIIKDWTKDKPGDYSPLPPATAEQLSARIEARQVKDWDDAWRELTGKTWAAHERDVTVGEVREREAAAKNVHMSFDPNTKTWNPKQ